MSEMKNEFPSISDKQDNKQNLVNTIVRDLVKGNGNRVILQEKKTSFIK